MTEVKQMAEVSSKYLDGSKINPTPFSYKQTEVGVIPGDWEVKSGEELTLLIGKGASPRWQGFNYTNDGMLFVTSENVRDGFLDISEPKYLPLEFHEKLKRSKLRVGDILINLVGASIGRSCRVEQDLGEANINQAVSVFRVSDKFNSKYVACYLGSSICIERILNMQVDAARPNISLSDLRKFLVPIPQPEEQTAIANALSDVDALINSLEKLIAKKQAIKTATMQQLLTGKTRLPQFATHPDGTPKGYKQSELGEIPEDWEVVQLRDVTWFQEGPGVRQNQFTANGIKLLNGTNIEKERLVLEKTQRYISEKLAFGQYSHFMIDDGDVLIACSGVTIERFDEKVTMASQEHLPLCLNTSTMRFKPSEGKINKVFFTSFLKSDAFKSQIGGKATGSAQLNFGPYHVNQVKIALPVLDEQVELASHLSDVDSEISVLEIRLNKTRQLKQGMMQELLSGKTRLVKPAGSTA